jgi:hypothetical protein
MVSRLVRENLMRRARRFNLILDDVSITHVAFSPEFTHAVEAKQVAQQIAQRAAFLVDQAIQEKQSIIVRAQGEARSAELIGEAVRSNKGFLQLRKLEAAREIANTLAQSGNKVMLDAKSLLLNGEYSSVVSLFGELGVQVRTSCAESQLWGRWWVIGCGRWQLRKVAFRERNKERLELIYRSRRRRCHHLDRQQKVKKPLDPGPFPTSRAHRQSAIYFSDGAIRQCNPHDNSLHHLSSYPTR